MAYPFALGTISAFLVETYDGFDRPNRAALVDLISDGTSTNDQVMQQGGQATNQATVTGWLYESADVVLARGYRDSKEIVDFTDGDGATWSVVVFDFTAKSLTGRWRFTATLVDAG